MSFILAASMIMVLSTILLGVLYFRRGIPGKHGRKILGINITVVFGLLLVATIVLFSGSAFAEDTAASGNPVNGLGLIAAGLSTGLACIGAGIAVAAASSAALGAISEDSRLLGKTLIFVGLAEGIAIYGLIVSILILGRL